MTRARLELELAERCDYWRGRLIDLAPRSGHQKYKRLAPVGLGVVAFMAYVLLEGETMDHERIETECGELAQAILTLRARAEGRLPVCRETALVLTKLDEATLWLGSLAAHQRYARRGG